MRCRVCDSNIDRAVYEVPAPALTSIMTFIDAPTVVYVCDTCGHAQCIDLPDIREFYDVTYRISLDSDDHDQVFRMSEDGVPVYRTDHQAAISLQLLDLSEGTAILDYGAAKSDTLRKMVALRPDLLPHVFDVSSDYVTAWQGWVKPEDQATYAVPESWAGRFQAIMSHFVIEHVAEPVAFLKVLHGLLAPGGRLLLSMPNVAANPGDMAVADHLNHFSLPSLKRALAIAGFTVEVIDDTAFPGAFFCVAVRSETAVETASDIGEVAQAVAKAREICQFWRDATRRLDEAAKRHTGKTAAVYGSGFYGSWICSRIQADVPFDVFLDQNPKLQGATHLERPIRSPAELDDGVEVVFVGLNPLKARGAIAQQQSLQRPGLTLVWLDA